MSEKYMSELTASFITELKYVSFCGFKVSSVDSDKLFRSFVH